MTLPANLMLDSTAAARQMFFFGQDLSLDLVCPQLIPQQ
jgi:hypothetical protein